MRHAIYLHIVWTTLGRAPLIDHDRGLFLRRHLRNVAREERALVLGVGLVTTHLHVMVRVHPTCNISRLMQRWKGGSALICNREQIGDPLHPLRWAKGSSVTSVGLGGRARLLEYLKAQATHHPKEAITRPTIRAGSSL